MPMTKPWWRLVHIRPDDTDGEAEELWTERSALNTAKMARKAGGRCRLERWTPACAVLSDDREVSPMTTPAIFIAAITIVDTVLVILLSAVIR